MIVSKGNPWCESTCTPSPVWKYGYVKVVSVPKKKKKRKKCKSKKQIDKPPIHDDHIEEREI